MTAYDVAVDTGSTYVPIVEILIGGTLLGVLLGLTAFIWGLIIMPSAQAKTGWAVIGVMLTFIPITGILYFAALMTYLPFRARHQRAIAQNSSPVRIPGSTLPRQTWTDSPAQWSSEQASCGACGGTGKTTCYRCNGTGMIRGAVGPPDGYGGLRYSDEYCGSCYGGTITCSACGGSGRAR